MNRRKYLPSRDTTMDSICRGRCRTARSAARKKARHKLDQPPSRAMRIDAELLRVPGRALGHVVASRVAWRQMWRGDTGDAASNTALELRKGSHTLADLVLSTRGRAPITRHCVAVWVCESHSQRWKSGKEINADQYGSCRGNIRSSFASRRQALAKQRVYTAQQQR